MLRQWKRPAVIRGIVACAILLTVGSAHAADVLAPMVAIVNPGNKATVSGKFKVQVRVYQPTGMSGVTAALSTDGGTSFGTTLTQNASYSVGTNTAVFEAQLTLTAGQTYNLVARSTKSTTNTLSTAVAVTVAPAKQGDGALLRRDNSSQICSDCHNLKTHSSESTDAKYGAWNINCRDCHTPHQTTNAHLVANQITPPGTTTPKNVYFSKTTGVSGVAGATDKPNASFVNSDVTGVCQVCHTKTTRYTNTALGSTAHAGVCTDCHPHTAGFKGDITKCTGCHGDVTRTGANAHPDADVAVAAAPPRDADEVNPGTLPTDPQVGAHMKHVNNIGSTLRAKPLPCSECHGPAHSGVPAPGVVFGTGTPSLATTGGVIPQYSLATPASPKCSNVYCHGAYAGGKNTTMTWNVPSGGSLACDTCHAMPPPDANHQPTAQQPDPTRCQDCHAGFTSSTVDKNTHINGIVNLTACTRCHGTESRVGVAGSDPDQKGSPPLDSAGLNGPKVGDHLAHVNKAPATARSNPMWCRNCHADPRPLGHDSDNNTLPYWTSTGSLAVVGGATPQYGITDPAATRVPANMTCASTYCHGQFTYGRKNLNTPYWGQGPAGATCGSCHLLPPALPHPPDTNCDTCHPGYSSATSTVVAATHVDGLPTLAAGRTGCVGCHGNPSRTSIATGYFVDPNQQAAPPYGAHDETATSTKAVGAHVAHVNQNTLRNDAIACTECHPDTTGTAHANNTPAYAWGPLATSGGASATYVPWNGTTLTCANYCHGSTLPGGTNKNASWVGGVAQAGCGSCHLNAFATVAAGTNYHPTNTACSSCHGAGYANATTVDKATHLDKAITFQPARSGACNKCHGLADGTAVSDAVNADPNVLAAPGTAALATSGTDAGQGVAGTHLAHVNQSATNPFMKPIHCTECHGTDKANAADHANGNAQPVWTSAVIAKAGGMASPQYVQSTGSCSANYCHSKYAVTPYVAANLPNPTWTGAGRLGCGACHGDPPAVQPDGVTVHPQNGACSQCHPGYSDVGASPRTVNLTYHLNGSSGLAAETVAMSCTACHGGTLSGGTGATGANPVASAPPKGSRGELTTSQAAVGLHATHLTSATLAANAAGTAPRVACVDCHAVPTANYHAEGTGAPTFVNPSSAFAAQSGASSYTGVAASYATSQCSNTYCHGNFKGGVGTGAVAWNPATVPTLACTACHANPPIGAPTYHPTNPTCAQCHNAAGDSPVFTATAVTPRLHIDGAVTLPGRAGACNKCHGSLDGYVVNSNLGGPADANVISAPGTAASTRALAVGAHQVHVNPSGPYQYMAPIACTECHGPNKTSAADHANGSGAPVWTSAILSTAAGMTSPVYDANGGGCTATYCHSKYTQAAYGSFTGAVFTTPLWGTAAKLNCESCHGDPPRFTTSGGDHSASPACSTCHSGYADKGADSSPRGVNLARHLDGVVDAAGCTGCHGGTLPGLDSGPNPIASAPPKGVDGETLTTQPAVGAHERHLFGGSVRAAMVCADCHLVPTDSAHAGLPLDLTWGSLARTGGVTPSYSGTPNYTCNNYCHGATLTGGLKVAAAWTGGSAEAQCNSCHGNPPPYASAPYHPSSTDCGACHGTGYTNAAVPVAANTHVDGTTQLPNRTAACNRCHGWLDAGATGGFVAAASSAANAIGAPGAAATTSTLAAGAHTAHVNQATTPMSAPFACGECHYNAANAANGGVYSGGSDGHVNNAGTPVWNAAVAPVATAGGMTAPTYSAGSCSATYCHNKYTAAATPSWTTAGKLGCTACHAVSFATVAAGTNYHPTSTACAGCHGTGNTATTVVAATHVNGAITFTPARSGACNKCHGLADGTAVSDAANADPNVLAAPGAAALATSGTDAGQGVAGTHLAHVNQSASNPFMKPIHCTECHGADKANAADHANGNAQPVWTSAVIATAGGMTTPQYVASSGSCSANYCHSKYAVTPYVAANLPNPTWTGAGRLGCGACHGDPPAVQPDGVTVHPQNGACSQCHPGYSDVGASPRTVNLTYHLNGTTGAAAETVAMSCTSCHGGTLSGGTGATGTNPVASAPPKGSRGELTTSQAAVGLHANHLTSATLSANAAGTAPRVACVDCHTVPTANYHANGTGAPTFVNPASAFAAQSGASSYTGVAAGYATNQCSNTYCHGNFKGGVGAGAVTWNPASVPTLGCTACHGNPPTGAPTYHPTNATCAQCHNVAGDTPVFTSTAVTPRLHIDGAVALPNRTGACNKCHGWTDVGSTGGFVAAASSAVNAIAAPGTAGTTSASAAGAHTAHVNKVSGPMSSPFACGECHYNSANAANGGVYTAGSDGHVNNAGTPVWNTAVAPIATAGGMTAPAYAGGTCSATYCHNKYTTAATPAWTTTGPLPCTSCHAVSFATVSSTTNYHPTNTSCTSCHGTGNNATTVVASTHVNAAITFSPARTGTCNKCHGQPDGTAIVDAANADTNVLAAPGTPARTTSGTDAGQGVAGAHQAHVNQSGTYRYMKPIHCTECHGADKAAASDHANGTTTPDMASASTIADATGIVPVWTASSGSCATTYCHGKYATSTYGGWNGAPTTPTPTWPTAGKLNCDACHGDPPRYTTAGADHDSGSGCSGCHPGYGDRGVDSSPRLVDLNKHINGVVDVSMTPTGNAACGGCHGALVASMAAGNTSGYHHLMQNANATSDLAGSKYPNAGGDATSANRRCLLCHADHDVFGPDVNGVTTSNQRGKNLRTDIAVTALSTAGAGTGYTNTDFDGTLTNGGICVSCHTAAQTKSYAQRDGSTTTMVITKAGYTGSVHNYAAESTFGDSSTFQANCTKCHGDTDPKSKQTSAAPNQFGLHNSYQRRMTNSIKDVVFKSTITSVTDWTVVDTNTGSPLASIGRDALNGFAITVTDSYGTRTNIIKATGYDATGVATANSLVMAKPWTTVLVPVTGGGSKAGAVPLAGAEYVINDPEEERLCGQCHSGGQAGLDSFNTPATRYKGETPGTQMTQRSKTFDQYLKIYGAGTITIAANAATVTGTNTNWYVSDATATATFTHDSQFVDFNKALATSPTWLGRSIKDGQAGRGAVRWYSIVGITTNGANTRLIISPPYFQPTTTSTAWAISFGDWYLQCATDTGWYRVNDVTGNGAATIYPNYGGAVACPTGSQYVMRSVPGHPLALTAAVHKPDEVEAQDWNGGGTSIRHVTCMDCHNTHNAAAGNHTPGAANLGLVNEGVAGVAVTYATPRTLTGTFSTTTRTTITGVTGVTAADVGKNVYTPWDGLVYPIKAVSGTTITIGLTYGYKGTLTGAQSFQIQDPVTDPAFTVVASLGTSNKQHELCMKCHSKFAYGTNPPRSMFFSSTTLGTAANGTQTDMSRDFNPYQLAYHPIIAVGRNQPPDTANPNWASSAGRKAATFVDSKGVSRTNPNAGFDNTFADGWGKQSLVACTDCHQSESATDPWGPHGTANQWLLKGIDPNVTVTLASGTVVTPNICFYTGGGTAVSGVPDTGDMKNACLNCHRADVYGLMTSGGSSTGSSCNGNNAATAPTAGIPYANLSRVNHPVDARAESNSTKGLTRQGIYCMQCHGGDALGAIHGTNSTSAGTNKSGGVQGSYRGKRFMNGATWSGTTRASTTAGVSCTTNKTLAVDTCGDTRDSTGNLANYNYDSGAD